jgi:sugar phosphate isomerase/epimerase
MGYQGIEIMADTPHAYPGDLTERDVETIRRALDEHHMEVSNINAFMMHAEGDTYHPSWIEKDRQLRRRRIEHTLRCINLAEMLGARTLSTEPGGPLEGLEPSEGFRIFRDGLETVQDRAREAGIRILIEPEPGLLIENSIQFRSFFKDLDPNVFGLNFDIGHFFCVGEDPATLISDLKEFTCHFHLEDIAASREHFHLMPGEGAIDFPSVLKAMRDINYTGFVTVELYPYEDRAVEAARNSLVFLQKLCEATKDESYETEAA